MADPLEKLFNKDLGTLEDEVLQLYVDGADRKFTGGLKDDIGKLRQKASEAISEQFNKNREILNRRVCVELEYCKLVKSEELKMAKYIIDGGVLAVFQVPVPAAHLSVYLLRLGYFDRLCQCDM